ncbi:MAG: hypothetical protein GF398_03450 [Chitinivibrionales bacterium]|nr:hypothetical protein [Chitinivibrionales bacterium]
MLDKQNQEERIDHLDALLGQFIAQTNTSFIRTERHLQDLSKEVNNLKAEMKDFKDEMRDFKASSDHDRKEMNKKWGALANKMGTLVEDIVAPAIPPAVANFFNSDVVDLFLNSERKSKSLNLQAEFDAVAATETHVFIFEVKSRPRIQDPAITLDVVKSSANFIPNTASSSMCRYWLHCDSPRPF